MKMGNGREAGKQGRGRAEGAVGLIGGGNMAEALVRGLLQAGLCQPDELIVSDVESRRRSLLRRRYGVTTVSDNAAVLEKARIVVLAVKPQVLDGVLRALAPLARGRHLFVSIAAGITTARIEEALGGRPHVLRVMPNTPAVLGLGVSVLVRGRWATAADEKRGVRLLQAVGMALAVRDEEWMDAVTGVSGSGPAYVYLFAEALVAGGVAAGLPAALAQQLAFQTLTGAAAMLQRTKESPATLRAQVTSPGGTTFAGLGELERRGFSDGVVAAVLAATERSKELGRN